MEPGELPEAYGTGSLFLTPRDPWCLCANWDLTSEQLERYKGLASGQSLILRLYKAGGSQLAELAVPSESRYRFIPLEQSGGSYSAELGYYSAAGEWQSISVSQPVAPPAKTALSATEPPVFAKFEFPPKPSNLTRPVHQDQAVPAGGEAISAKVPHEVSFGNPLPFAAYASSSIPCGPYRIRARMPERPVPSQKSEPGVAVGQWTAGQEKALAELIGFIGARWQPVSSAEAAQVGLPIEAGVSSPRGAEWGAISSPVGGRSAPAGFWLNVNAELVVYGATQANAQVSMGGRPVRLRPDGTFSYRFAFPDGNYSMPISARAPDGQMRQVELQFQRATNCKTDVGIQPQDSALQIPTPQKLD